MIMALIFTAIVWNLDTWYLGIPLKVRIHLSDPFSGWE